MKSVCIIIINWYFRPSFGFHLAMRKDRAGDRASAQAVRAASRVQLRLSAGEAVSDIEK